MGVDRSLEPVAAGAELPASPTTSEEADSPATGAWVFPQPNVDLFEALRQRRYRRVGLQVPAGLTKGARELAERIRQETGAEVTLVARACFGACDFPSRSELPNADAWVLLGHAPIPNVRLSLPTYFVEMRHPGGDPEALAQTLAAAGLPRRLGLVASVQHLDLVAPLCASAAARGFHIEVGSGDRRLAYPGQALGCNYTSAESLRDRVEGFVFLGTGRFHPLGLALAVDRPVWSLDPLRNQIEPPVDRGALLRNRFLVIAACRSALRWGVLVSSFAGQNRSPLALSLVRRAREKGREAEVVVFGRLDPADLVGRDFDAYVNTACPRIALDDGELYSRPMLTPPEFLAAIADRPIEDYRFDTYH